MNKRLDYKYKELVLRMLLMLVIKLDCKDDPRCDRRNFAGFEQEVRETCLGLAGVSRRGN